MVFLRYDSFFIRPQKLNLLVWASFEKLIEMTVLSLEILGSNLVLTLLSPCPLAKEMCSDQGVTCRMKGCEGWMLVG